MGISSNQARFLALTSRQVDLENRVQQICQRRLRLSSELERVATDYNNQIGNRQMFTFNTANSGINQLSISGILALKDTNGNNYRLTRPGGSNRYAGGVTYGGGELTVTQYATPNVVLTAADLGVTFPSGATEAQKETMLVEAALRNGQLSIATKSDEFTQTSVMIYTGSTDEYFELRDWRTLPDIADELYKNDDMDAENKYDRIVSQINQQDKKLQLEQASVEVEYKAISSEKEAVKKILDTNSSLSFKYFG